MLITAIEPKKKGLSAVYIDGEFAMKIDTETLILNHIDIGSEIDDDILHNVLIKSQMNRCKERALRLISFRDHSKHELFEKLIQDYPEDTVNSTIERLEELNLLDDLSYAQRYTKDLCELKHLPPKGIRQKLLQKGIDRDIIDEVLDEFEIDELEQIRYIINKKYSNITNDEKTKRRAVNALLRLGHSYQNIKTVISEYTEYEDF